MWLGHANVVEFYDDWQVHRPSVTMDVPCVMVSNEFIKKKHYVRFSRINLLLRDNFECQYCGAKLDTHSLTVDHVMPRVRGGLTTWTNITCSCIKCNTLKSHRISMLPKNKPYKPEYQQLLQAARKTQITIPDSKWLLYLNWDETLVKINPPSKK
jgi:5-methylcytosine-specific restriction endonuclease McrA